MRRMCQIGLLLLSHYLSLSLVPMKMGSKRAIKKAKVPALLHRGEVVLTAGQVKALKKILK